MPRESGEVPQPGDFEKAQKRFERRLGAKKYNGNAIRESLDELLRTGSPHFSTPADLFTGLANWSAQAAEVAATHNQADSTEFAGRSERYRQTSQGFTAEGFASLAELAKASQRPSNPRRKTGIAAG